MFRRLILLSLFAAAFVVTAMPPASAAEKQTLTMAYWWGPKHHMFKDQQKWVASVKKISHGDLIIKVDTAGIGKPPGQYDLVKNGIRDMVWFIAGYTPGRFPLYQVAELPFVCPNATTCGMALWDWYEGNNLEKREFTDTKLVLSFAHGPGVLHSNREIKTVDDMVNVKVRAGGSNVAIGKALDMAVVAMPASEAYEAIHRHTVDAIFFPWEAINSFRLNEVAHYHLEVPGGMYASSFGFNINPKAWDGLTRANKDALMKAGGHDGSRLVSATWDAADKVARDDALKRKDNVIQTIAASEMPKLRKKLDVVRQNWIDLVNKKGLDGQKLYDDFLAKVRANSS